MAKQKRKLTAKQKAEKKRRRQEYMTIFIHGKQKRVKRPPTIDGMDVEEFIRNNADPIWLHQNQLWEDMEPERDSADWICLMSKAPIRLAMPAQSGFLPNVDGEIPRVYNVSTTKEDSSWRLSPKVRKAASLGADLWRRLCRATALIATRRSFSRRSRQSRRP
jgi:hypothetical protein